MQTIISQLVALWGDKAGSATTRTALMIGLSSSAMLVLVRIGVAVASQ
ncbi:MAG: hypothetical protein ISP45_02715 [Reyranella sp.]|nr:hypothetical protein [Reyranella sp.]